jgi:hypothetical protein
VKAATKSAETFNNVTKDLKILDVKPISMSGDDSISEFKKAVQSMSAPLSGFSSTGKYSTH